MQNNITTFDKNKFMPYSIGFDDLFDKLFDIDFKNDSYPHYNISKISDNNYLIEMALAGFNKNQIEIQISDGELTVMSKKKLDHSNEKSKDSSFIHQGISQRSFIRKFTLSDEIEVKNADMKNGMLYIKLEKIIPEHKKPKMIPIK